MQREKTIDRESQQKLYVQMYSIIKEKIESGEWPTGSQIPTEDDLCVRYRVSKVTVRQAIAELVRTGYLRKQQGKGTFVMHSAPDLGITTMKTRLAEDLFGKGVTVTREILVRGIKDPPEDVKLTLRPEGSVYYILCKRVVDDEPAYLEESFVPLELFPRIEEETLSHASFYELIQAHAVKKVHRVVQTIEVAEIAGDAAAVLKTAPGTPGLLFHRLFLALDGTPLGYLRLRGTGRTYKLQTELLKIS